MKKLPTENQIKELSNKLEENDKNNVKKDDFDSIINNYDSTLEKFENIDPNSIKQLTNQVNNINDNLKKINKEQEIQNKDISTLKNSVPLIENKSKR